MVFVDTSAWFALFVPVDARHARAVEWFRKNTEPLLTTDYIVDELLTLLARTGEKKRSTLVRSALLENSNARLEFVTEEDFFDAWRIYEGFEDKYWSFTDCTCKVVMERLGIDVAFSFDHHFRQFGRILVVP